MLGGYEANPLPFEMRDASPQFQIADMPLDVQVLRGLAAAVRDQFPGLEDAPLQLYRGGLPTMTADGKHIVGAVPGAEGFYTATGCVVGGLSISPGMGEMLAQLILTGASDIPLDLYSVSRFSPDFNEDELVEACVDAYAHHYSEDYTAIEQRRMRLRRFESSSALTEHECLTPGYHAPFVLALSSAADCSRLAPTFRRQGWRL